MNNTTKPVDGCLSFVWSVAAEDVGSGRGAIALISGGRSVFKPNPVTRMKAASDCSFFVESRRGEVVIQVLAELVSARVFATLSFDLSRPGAVEALRELASQESLSIHAFTVDGSPLGTAHAPIGEARRAWIGSALDRAARGASVG